MKDAPTYEVQEDQANSVQQPKKKGAGGGHLLDSGWMQALVPLAAIAATAIAPRKAGPAAHIGLGAYNAAQGARQGQLADERHENRYDQRRMQDVMQRKTERDEGRSYAEGLRLQDISRGKEEKATRRADLVKALRGQAGVPGADMIGEPKQTSTTPPAGGGAPEAQSAVNATRFEQTRTPPRPTTGLPTEAVERILAMFDVDEGAAMREWDEETDTKSAGNLRYRKRNYKGMGYETAIDPRTNQPTGPEYQTGPEDYNPPQPHEPRGWHQRVDSDTLEIIASGKKTGDREIDANLDQATAQGILAERERRRKSKLIEDDDLVEQARKARERRAKAGQPGQ